MNDIPTASELIPSASELIPSASELKQQIWNKAIKDIVSDIKK